MLHGSVNGHTAWLLGTISREKFMPSHSSPARRSLQPTKLSLEECGPAEVHGTIETPCIGTISRNKVLGRQNEKGNAYIRDAWRSTGTPDVRSWAEKFREMRWAAVLPFLKNERQGREKYVFYFREARHLALAAAASLPSHSLGRERRMAWHLSPLAPRIEEGHAHKRRSSYSSWQDEGAGRWASEHCGSNLSRSREMVAGGSVLYLQ